MKMFFSILMTTIITVSNGNAGIPGSTEPIDVSVINLIATPNKYHHKLIRVIGYLNLEFERNALYIHKEDYEKSLLKNAIWIDLSRKDISEKIKTVSKQYVIIEGIFDKNDTGHMGLFSGSITKISRLDLWK